MEAMIWMTGHVGSDVEVREVREDVFIANFRLACTPRLWKGGEWSDAPTTWVGVTCGRSLALNVKSSVNKGDPVVVVGRLRTRRWNDQQGVEHERLNVDAQIVGHDLNRGTSVFRKAATKAVVEDSDAEIGEMILATEAQTDEEEQNTASVA